MTFFFGRSLLVSVIIPSKQTLKNILFWPLLDHSTILVITVRCQRLVTQIYVVIKSSKVFCLIYVYICVCVSCARACVCVWLGSTYSFFFWGFIVQQFTTKATMQSNAIISRFFSPNDTDSTNAKLNVNKIVYKIFKKKQKNLNITWIGKCGAVTNYTWLQSSLLNILATAIFRQILSASPVLRGPSLRVQYLDLTFSFNIWVRLPVTISGACLYNPTRASLPHAL